MKIDYNKELGIYTSEFMERLSQSFEMAGSKLFNKVEEVKNKTQFGYSIEEKITCYEGETIQLKEFPFKWGFNGELEIGQSHMAQFCNEKREFLVPNEMNMEFLYKKTLEEKDAFFEAIIAKLLLQDYVAIMRIPEKSLFTVVHRKEVTTDNSSVFGTIDCIEYVFNLVVFKEPTKDNNK